MNEATNNPLDTVSWVDRRRSAHALAASPAMGSAPIETGIRLHDGFQFKNRQNGHGLYVFNGDAKWHESKLELRHLVDLDYQGEITALATQALRFDFRASSPCSWHIPDFFAVHRNGDRYVYDVKPTRFMNERARAQFAETGRVCGVIGWQYRVLHDNEGPRADNLSHLRMSRHSHLCPTAATQEQIIEICRRPTSVSTVASMLNRRLPALALPGIKHLLWHRQVTFDLDVHLDLNTLIRTTGKESPCLH